MIRKMIVPLLLVLALGAVPSTGCAKAPPTLSPAGAAAFNALRVGHALDLVRDTANDAAHQTPPLLTRASLLKVVAWHESAVKTIVAVPGGWKPTVLAGLDQLKADLSPDEWQRLALYVSLAKTVITEVQP